MFVATLEYLVCSSFKNRSNRTTNLNSQSFESNAEVENLPIYPPPSNFANHQGKKKTEHCFSSYLAP